MLARRPEFPGMDPWLEHPARWPDVHNRLIAAIADELNPVLGNRYFVGVEERVYIWSVTDQELLGVPDLSLVGPSTESPIPRWGGGAPAAEADPEGGLMVLEVEVPGPIEVHETFLEILDVERNVVVTVIELISPSNKQHTQGRAEYLEKRTEVFASSSSLVEIDLTRAGEPLPIDREHPPADYRILIRRPAPRGRGAMLYAFGLRRPIPAIPIPLASGEPEPVLELNEIVRSLMQRARYYRVLPYDKPPVPPLRPADAEWAAAIVAQAKQPA